jgi:hypothetical protein
LLLAVFIVGAIGRKSGRWPPGNVSERITDAAVAANLGKPADFFQKIWEKWEKTWDFLLTILYI